jgi:DME family drug/metabolite transporter
VTAHGESSDLAVGQAVQALRRSALRGRLLVFSATILWGTSAALARFVFHERHVPALTVVELRLVIASIVLALYLSLRRPARLRVARGDWGYFATLGLLGVAAIQGAYYYSISALGVGLAILLQYLAPVLIVLYEFLRGSRIRAHMVLAVAAAAFGTALVVGSVNPAAVHAKPLDWVIGFGQAFMFAFYIVFSKRGLERYAPETVLLYTFAIAAILWSIVTPPWRIVAAAYPAQLWWAFIALGLFSTLVPFSLFYAGLKHLTPSEAAIVATFEPVAAVLAAAIFLAEGLSLIQWIGAALVLAGAAVSSVRIHEALPAQPERS